MAITFIEPIKQPLRKSINYILNQAKTEQQTWVQCYNCPQERKAAYRAMMETKERENKPGGVQGHMLYFSFAPGEVDKKTAFDILNAFAGRYLASRYETIVAMHTDKDHIHGHILFNSVSFADGKKYHSNAQEYFGQIRKIADELCAKHGLNIIIPDKDKGGKHYIEYQMEKHGFTTWKELARHDIDCVLRQSVRFSDFLIRLENMGYTINNDPKRKHITIQPPGMTSCIRLSTLGKNYSEEAIKARIVDRLNHYERPKKPQRRTRRIPTRYNRDFLRGYNGKIQGIRALYLRYLYTLGKVKKAKRITKRHYPLRRDVLNFEKHLKAYRFIAANNLESFAKVEQIRLAYETQYQNSQANIEAIKKEEAPLKMDFGLLAEYEGLKPAYSLYQNGYIHMEEAAAAFLQVRASLRNRGYESEEKIKTLSQKKADMYEHKEQAKENQRQIRAVLKDCKNVLQSFRIIGEVAQEQQQIAQAAQEQEQQKSRKKEKQR